MWRSDTPYSFSFLLAAALLPAAAIAQSTTRISVAASGAQLVNPSYWGSISGDGRYAAFVAMDGVLPGDTNNTTDVFVRELATGIVQRVSLTAAGVQPNGPCFDPQLSDDGRFVAFGSWATNLAASDTNGVNGNDIFVKDLLTGSLQHVSKNVGGVGGNDISAYHHMSGDGRFVTFYSYSTNLVPNDADSNQDTYLVDRTTGQIQCLSIDPISGLAAGGGSGSLSDDGRFIAFETWAPLFGAADSTIALFDRLTGTYTAVPQQSGQVLFAVDPVMSGDGSTVLFGSAFSFDPADTDFAADVYAYDVASGTHRLVSVPPAPGLNAPCYLASASRDARYVMFRTNDAYVPVDTNGLDDAYVIDTVTGALELLSRGDAGQNGNTASYPSYMSDSGRRCVFGSSAGNLVSNDTNSVADVFVRDRAVAAAWITYGAGFPGTGGVVPGIALLSPPAIGTTTLLGVANNTGAQALMLLVFGLQPVSVPTPVIGTLLVDPLLTIFAAPLPPALIEPIVIPDVLELAGAHAYLQALILDAGATAGVAFTRGIDARIGG